MPVKIRSSVQKLSFSPTLAIHEQVRKRRAGGAPILHMGFGQSPFPVHAVIRAALAANAEKNLYLPSAGLPELRAAARDYYGAKFGFDPGKFAALVGPGSKELIYDLQMAVEGDLLLPVPSWVSYEPQSRLLQDKAIKIPTTRAENYHISPESLEAAILAAQKAGYNPRKLILNYPNNPSGLSISASRLEQIAQVCRKYELLVISDEIYGLVDFKGQHTSIARFYPQGTVVTTGLSKHLSLGGYRLGIALIPQGLQDVYEAMVRIASETWSCVCAPVQYAALKAFEHHPQVEAYIHTCTQIHKWVSGTVREALVEMGIPYPPLQGGFYLYPDFSPFREKLNAKGVHTSDQLALDLLEEMNLATLPGTAFGDGEGNLRLRLATCDYDGGAALAAYERNPDGDPGDFVRQTCPNITLACERLKTYLEA